MKLNSFDKFKVFLYKIIKPEKYTYTYHKKWHPDYCHNLIKLLDTLPRPIEVISIVKYSCGHYGFSNGQHRTCIAAALDQNIDIVICDEDKECSCCLIKGTALFLRKL